MNWENMNGKKWRTCKRLPVLCHLKLCFITLCALIRLSIYFLLVGLFLIFAPPNLSVLPLPGSGLNRRNTAAASAAISPRKMKITIGGPSFRFGRLPPGGAYWFPPG